MPKIDIKSRHIGWVEDNSLRNRTSKTFINPDNPLQREWVGGLSSGHYKEDNVWQDINTDILSSSLINWDWEMNKNNWTLLVKNGGWCALANKEDGYGIEFRLLKAAYLNVVTKDYTVLANANYSTPIVSGGKLTWNGLFPNVNVEVVADIDRFEQLIHLSQQARDALPASPYPINDTYLVWLYQVDWKKAPQIEDEETGNTDNNATWESKKKLFIKTTAGVTSSFLPEIAAFHSDEALEVEPIKIRRRFFKKQDEYYLLEGIPLSSLNAMPQGTVIFDDGWGPTQVTASEDDSIELTDGNAVPDHAYGPRMVSPDYILSGQRWLNVTIPNAATISAAIIEVNCFSTSYDDPNGLNLYGEDIDSALAFTDTIYDISDRTVTTATVDWPATGVGAGWVTTPDITDIIQEIVNRGGWASGNDLAIIWVIDVGGNFICYAYDSGSSYGAKLSITYGEAGEEVLLTATCSATSSTTGSLTLGKIESLTAASAGATNVPSTTLQLLYSITAHAPPATSVAGSLSIVKSLAGTSSVTSSTQGSLTVGKVEALTATSVATSIASGSLILGKIETLSSTAEASTSVNGSLTVLKIIFLSGTASAGSSTQGSLTLYKAISALAETSSEILATLSVIFRCTAIINISTSTLAKLFLLIERLKRPEGVWQKQDRPTGVWIKMESPEGVWERQDKPADGAIKQEKPSGTSEKQKIPFD